MHQILVILIQEEGEEEHVLMEQQVFLVEVVHLHQQYIMIQKILLPLVLSEMHQILMSCHKLDMY